ncbi:type I polyketide synthase [Paludisphaera borealis]|uniref:type I polyketide synthase n=1 Tax=Paludisphaera borealis TaxID=1387353 RepID=UPI001AF002AB|nr:type I polyketide synthase [Paludisphaera borealis]
MTQADSSRPVPVAIIGMGCLFPMADGLERYWSNIRGRLDAITEVPPTHWRPEDYFDQDPKAADRTYAHRGGFLSPVDFPLLDFGIAPHTVEATDTTQLLGLLVAKKALEDAGYGAGRDYARDRVSVILGVTGTLELVIPLGARLGHPIWRRALDEAGVDAETAADVVQRISDSYVGWQENSFPGLLGNVAAGRIANRLDLGGANCVVDAACASSLGAVNLAMHELASGRCDVALSGGLDTFNDIFMYMCFSKTPALSPSGDARPFAASGDGTILGEGLGVLVLKRLDDAKRDGDRIYAVIRSMGASSDGKGQSIYAPVASGQVKALRQAYEQAGVTPDSIELIEAHGTGTRVGDGVEVEALEEVYRGARPDGPWCALGSVKSQIGHAKAAAGAAGLIKAALALHHKVLPPTIKIDRPIDPLARDGSPFYLNVDNRPWVSTGRHPRRAAVSAFGFGGSNFHCVLEEVEPDRAAVDWGGDVQLLAYSADDPKALDSLLPRWSDKTSWPEVRAEAARSRSAFRSTHRVRLLIVAQRGEENLPGLIEEARDRLKSSAAATKTVRARRVFFGEGDAPGRLAFLFPGQGSQYVGMLRDLACRFPRMLSALEAADAATTSIGARLSDRIYPPSVFSDDERRRQDEALRDTRSAQPAIGAVSLGLLQILGDFGLRPDMVGGHSFGELTALHAAARIDARALAILANERGALMADCAGDKDSGAMLATFAPADQLAEFLRRHALDVVVANKNAPRQCVLSGPKAEIERAEALLATEKITARRLPVSAAFHSRFVAKARGPLLDALGGVEVKPGTIPVFANATGEPYPASADGARELLADQLAQPVEFTAMVEAMHRDGARTFVEVGPDAKLSGLVASILEGKAHAALAVDSARGEAGDLVGLATVLASLAASGYALDLPQWDFGFQPPPPATKRSGLTVPVCGAHPRPVSKPRPATPALAKPAVKAEAPPRPIASPTTSTAGLVAPSPTRTNQQKALVERTMNSSQNQTLASSNGHAHAPAPSRLPAPRTTSASNLAPVFQQTHDHLLALQQLAQQTAQLHQQFLEGQEATQRTFQTLLEQQLRLAGDVAPRPAAPVSQPAAVQPASLPAKPPAPKAVTPPPAPVAPPAPAPVKVSAPATNGRHVEAPPAPVSNVSETAKVLLETVAEKTGYPADMLELDMQLDADLGIDSIKRVEILSALQDRLPHAPAVQPDQLGTIRSLRDIVALLNVGGGTIATPQPAPAVSVNGDAKVAEVLLETVAEKTGYPADMLELDMQLDADLGIDSIKRVEILSALQDRLPHAPAVQPDQLGTIRSLRDIVALLNVGGGTIATPQPAPAVSVNGDAKVAEVLLETVAEKTGYPADMLELDMQLDADLGIDSIKRVEILSALQDRLPHAPAVQPDQLGTIRSLRDIVALLDGGAAEQAQPVARPEPVVQRETRPAVRLDRLTPRPRPLDAPDTRETIRLTPGGEVWITDDGSSLTAALETALVERGLRGRVISTSDPVAATNGQRPCGLIVVAPALGADDSFVKNAFRLIRAVGPMLRGQSAQGGAAALLTVSRLDGAFGLEGLGASVEPTSGGLAGLAKTASWEWPEVHCKAVDLDRDASNVDDSAQRIVEELIRSGPAEVGLSASRTIQVALDRVEWLSGNHRRRPVVDPGDLVVITGGARGITAEAAVALAAEFGPRLLLLGRTPVPDSEPAWLAALDDEVAVRSALRLHATEPMTPQKLNERGRQIMAQREIRRNLERINRAGGKAMYQSVDVRDRAAVRALIDQVQAVHGPVRGLIHAAGVLADRRIDDQTDDQFALVYDTKIDGLNAVFEAIEPTALRVLGLFSSSTARFGRTGQVAYAAANEVLNKWAQVQARRLPDCRVVSFNWGPWDGGMVTSALRPLFESEGVGLIPLADGARLVVRELQESRENPVEVVVLADPPQTGEPTPTPTPEPERSANDDLRPAFDRIVDVHALPVLKSHVIDGHAVLPMALIMEWLGEAALHRHPGLVVEGLDDLRLFKGVVLRDHKPVTVALHAGKGDRRGSALAVPVEMRGSLDGGREIVHARAVVNLAERHVEGRRTLTEGNLLPLAADRDEIYQRSLFHGPAMQAIERVEGCDEQTIAAWVSTAPAPASWIAKPLRQQWLTDPLAIDAAFQLMILWCLERTGSGSLPTAIGSYRQFRRRFPDDGVRVVATVRQSSDRRAVADVEFLDSRDELVARMESYECVIDASLNLAFRRNRLTHLETATN